MCFFIFFLILSLRMPLKSERFLHTRFIFHHRIFREWNICCFPRRFALFFQKRYNFIECVCNHVYSILYIIICRILWLWIRQKMWMGERKKERVSKKVSQRLHMHKKKNQFSLENSRSTDSTFTPQYCSLMRIKIHA